MSRNATLGTRSVIETHLQDHLRRRVSTTSSSFIVNETVSDVEGSDGETLFEYIATGQTIRVPASFAEHKIDASIASVASSYVTGTPFLYTAPDDQILRVRFYLTAPPEVRRASVAIRRRASGEWSDVAVSPLSRASNGNLECVVEGLVPLSAGDGLGIVLRTRPEDDAGTVSITSAIVRGDLAR